MAGTKISNAPQVTDATDVSDFLIPCATGDGSAKTITIKNLLAHCSAVLGVDSISEFSATKQYYAKRSGDGYCTYDGKLYRFTSPHLGAWTGNDVTETSLYAELLAFYAQTYEAVTVHISVADGGFSSGGISVGVAYDDGTTNTYTTDDNGDCTFNVEKGISYTVSVSSKSGYITMHDKKFSANSNSRNIYFVFNPTSSANNIEYVNVYPGSPTGSFTHFANTNITVNFSDGTSQAVAFDGSKWSFSVPHGTTYTIVMPTISNYRGGVNQTYTASLTERYVFAGDWWYVGDDTVLLLLEDGTECTTASFDTANADKVKFIHIATETLLATASTRGDGTHKCDFYIPVAQTNASKKWRASNTRFTSLPNIANKAWDYDGYKNTMAIKKELSDAGETQDSNYILTYLDSLSVVDLNGNALTPFVGSIGQLVELMSVFATYQTACNLIGKTALTLKSGNYWSSSQFSDTNNWSLLNGSPTNNTTKSYSGTSLPLYAF